MKMKKTIQQIDPRKIKTDPVADELAESIQMKPYVDFFEAAMNRQDVEPMLRRVADLQLNERYVWRVASALDWAFADCDSETARLDWTVMSEEERAEVSDMLRFRVTQIALFIKALYGSDELRRRFEEALDNASDPS